jgi:hypothetical protein
VQNGAFYTAVDSSGKYMLKPFNYPGQGGTGQLNGVQLGGYTLIIDADASGVQKIKNFNNLLVGTEPVTIACNAGKIVLNAGCMKMNGRSDVVWAFTQGPDKMSTVPNHAQTDDLKAGQKKMSSASKGIVLKLPVGEEDEEGEEGETVDAYVGRYQGQMIAKMDGSMLFEVGADGSELLPLAGGQANLLKLFNVQGLQLFLRLSKKIPGKPKGASLNIFAKHDEINDGNEILLFASAPVAGSPPHILQGGAKGVLPGGKSLKNLMDLPWTYELRPVIEQLVKPLVDFAVYFDRTVAAKKWHQKNVTRGLSTRVAGLVQLLTKLYKSQAKDKVERLLSYVTTNVTMEDGEWCSSGLMLDSKVKYTMKRGKDKDKESDEDSDAEDSDEESAGDDSDAEVLYVGTGKSDLSPAKSTRASGSSSGGSAKKAKKVTPPAHKRQRSVEVEAEELGGSDSDSDE